MIDRCTGACCQRFTLPFGPSEAWASFRELQRRNRGEKPDLSIRCYTDIDKVAPMLVYLGTFMADADWTPRPKLHHHFTCRYFDRQNKVCTVYERRPQVCRTHPTQQCLYKDCTWKAAREGRVVNGEEAGETP